MKAVMARCLYAVLSVFVACAVSFNLSANGYDFYLGCNEELDFGPKCSVEVKCYSPIDEGSYLGFTIHDDPPFLWYEGNYYFTTDDYNTMICGALIVADILVSPKTEYRCTQNGTGPDDEGDLAVEVEFNFTGCFVDD